jgi:hypothetical protein
MQKLSIMFMLIIGMSASIVMSQNADSVIVIFKNQQTIIPVPKYKNQSSISYTDSIQVIEVGISRRKPEDISLFPQFNTEMLTTKKHKSISKWFSQVGAGYIQGNTDYENEYAFTRFDVSIPSTLTTYTSMTDLNGYQIRLLVHEKEYYLDNKKSFLSGFVLGFSQNFLQAKQIFTYDDTTDFPPYVTEEDYDFKINSFQFMYQFGMSYYLSSWKLPTKINIGNYMGFSITRIIDKNYTYRSNYSHINSTLLQPYLGMEISKIGILFSVDLNVPHNSHNILFDNDIGGNICLSLTYSIF